MKTMPTISEEYEVVLAAMELLAYEADTGVKGSALRTAGQRKMGNNFPRLNECWLFWGKVERFLQAYTKIKPPLQIIFVDETKKEGQP